MLDIINIVLTGLLFVLYCLTWIGGRRISKRNEGVIRENNEARTHIQSELADIKDAVDSEAMNNRIDSRILNLQRQDK